MSNQDLRSMIEAALDDELKAVHEYSEIARLLDDYPTLQALVYSIIGDEYGHARTFTVLLALYSAYS
ncbi:MAG: hypothetical protein H0Z39_07625 [Peptococcaceae bacterium]|nr:hypothetical protein [Peptococcaceae bacterium]